jgi:hypothetical protein
MTKLDAESIGVPIVEWLLPLVIGLDPVARELQGIKRPPVSRRSRGIEIGPGYLEARVAQIDAVEFPAQLDQRAVAVRPDVGNDGADRLLNVFRDLTLCGEESGKARGKVRGSAVEAYRHCALSARDKPGFTGSMARGGRRVNPALGPLPGAIGAAR